MSGDVIDLRDARFVREVEALHTLGPRSLADFLIALGRAGLIRTELDTLLRRYRRINPAMVLAVDADRMPPPADLVDHLEFALRRVEEALASEDRLETLEQLRDAGAAIEDALIAARLGRRVSR